MTPLAVGTAPGLVGVDTGIIHGKFAREMTVHSIMFRSDFYLFLIQLADYLRVDVVKLS